MFIFPRETRALLAWTCILSNTTCIPQQGGSGGVNVMFHVWPECHVKCQVSYMIHFVNKEVNGLVKVCVANGFKM